MRDMKNVKLLKAKNGRGWFLDVDEVIFEAPLTAHELWGIYKVIKDNLDEIKADMDKIMKNKEKKKKIVITYYKGNKQMNELLRGFDLYNTEEGIFIQERATLTVKAKIDKKWKEKFIEAFTQAHEKFGFEVCNIEFI